MSVKLTYFDVRGRAEVIRLLLKYGGIEFEDERVAMDDWPKLKPNTPFGSLPLYEEHGRVSNQSKAICRYIAKKIKLTGTSDWEDLVLDALVDTLGDFHQHFSNIFRESDPKRKETLKATLIDEMIPFYLDRFEKIAEKNYGFLAFGRLTWPDFYFASLAELMAAFTGKNYLENRPNLQSVVNNVVDIPAIKEWMETRPKNPM